MKAVAKFKNLTASTRPPVMASILGDSGEGRFSMPPTQLSAGKKLQQGMEHRSQSLNLDDRKATESALVSEGVHRDLSGKFASDQDAQRSRAGPFAAIPNTIESDSEEDSDEDKVALTRLQTAFNKAVGPNELPPFRSSISHARTIDDVGRRGHAHDPLEDILYLRIGPSTFAGHSTQVDGQSFVPEDDDVYMVSESPGAADVDIYETAYRDEIERIMALAEQNNQEPQVYLTRRVDEKLLQLSGLAGKLMAHGEEAKVQIKDYTQFTARKARVTEVSRALREAARTEYEKRRQERKAWIETAKVERAKAGGQPVTPQVETQRPHLSSATSEPSIPRPLDPTNSWRAKAVDRGRSAKTAFSGLVSQVKKSRKTKDDAI